MAYYANQSLGSDMSWLEAARAKASTEAAEAAAQARLIEARARGTLAPRFPWLWVGLGVVSVGAIGYALTR